MVQRVCWQLFRNRKDLSSFEKYPLGFYSVRECVSTHVIGCGITKDEKDYLWRWKGRKRISEYYHDVELAWVNAKVTNVLCIRGACKYQVH